MIKHTHILLTVLLLALLLGLSGIGKGQTSVVKGIPGPEIAESAVQMATLQEIQAPKNIPGTVGQNDSPTVTNTFTGSGNWGAIARWSQGHIPLSTEDVIIGGTCAVNTTGVCLSLTVNSTRTLTINTTQSVTVGSGGITNNGTITLTAGSSTSTTYLNNVGNFTNAGTFTATGTYTTLYFNGTTAQTFTNNGTVTSPMYVMTMSNTAGLTLLGSNQITCQRVNLFYGTMTNSNKITLGNGGSTYSVVQIGSSTTYAAGAFDKAPTFNAGTGGYQILYAPALNNYTTSFEARL